METITSRDTPIKRNALAAKQKGTFRGSRRTSKGIERRAKKDAVNLTTIASVTSKETRTTAHAKSLIIQSDKKEVAAELNQSGMLLEEVKLP